MARDIYVYGFRSPIARIAAFVASIALTAVGAEICIYVGPVPYTMQNMGIVFAGLMLSPSDAALAQLCYLALIAFGLPIAAGAHGGPYVLLGYTAGYLWAFPLASALYSIASRSYLAKVGRSLADARLRDYAVLWLLTLPCVAPVYILGYAVFYAYAVVLGARGLCVWSTRAIHALLRVSASSMPLPLALFLASVAIFVPQDMFMDHVLGVALGIAAAKLMRSRGLA
ncbi:MAG: biotin transporter BioY [Crenarchaeota archaeon]|nr:biotin transporter BioY [Thermoproteota archaeon]